MTGTSPENAYLEQVLQQQAQVDQELRRAPAAAQAQLQRARAPTPARTPGGSAPATATALPASRMGDAAESLRAIDYRVTGFWFWRTVVVPPNVYVIHTRRGRTEPVTIGLGISFGFNPYRDAFLLI